MAAPMPRDAPETMMTLPVGESSSDRLSRSSIMHVSEQALINAAVVDDILAGHESALGAAEKGNEVTAFLRVGEPARRTTAQAVLDNRIVGCVLPLGMRMKIGSEGLGIEQPGADAVNRHIVWDQLAN